jgi:DNA polymerase III epsilon subunit family exonuclease
MPRPHNLISDSSLVQETHQLAHASGGRASFIQIAESVLRLSNIPAELAAGLVCDLIENDLRFRVDGDYLAINDDPNEHQPLNEIDFVVVDVEAIAGRSAPARVIEIGACRVRSGKITAEYETLLNAELPIPRFIGELTGITSEMLETAPAFADVVEPWLSFAADSVLVAHNANFDFRLLNQEINRVFPGSRMRNPELCTVRLAQRVLPGLDNHNLDALAEHFGFEIQQRHRAGGDARATARVLLGLLDELEIKGVRSLAEIRSFQVPINDDPAEVQLALNA